MVGKRQWTQASFGSRAKVLQKGRLFPEENLSSLPPPTMGMFVLCNTPDSFAGLKPEYHQILLI
jgi:hypothetical protein